MNAFIHLCGHHLVGYHEATDTLGARAQSEKVYDWGWILKRVYFSLELVLSFSLPLFLLPGFHEVSSFALSCVPCLHVLPHYELGNNGAEQPQTETLKMNLNHALSFCALQCLGILSTIKR